MKELMRCNKCRKPLHPKNKSGLCSNCYVRDNPSHKKLMAKKRKTKEYKEWNKAYQKEYRRKKKVNLSS